jgi:hypothetical protein
MHRAVETVLVDIRNAMKDMSQTERDEFLTSLLERSVVDNRTAFWASCSAPPHRNPLPSVMAVDFFHSHHPKRLPQVAYLLEVQYMGDHPVSEVIDDRRVRK